MSLYFTGENEDTEKMNVIWNDHKVIFPFLLLKAYLLHYNYSIYVFMFFLILWGM